MKTIPSTARNLAVISGFCCLCLTGCLFKPSGVTPRSFVLSPTSQSPASAPSSTSTLTIGIAPVKIPGYLFKKTMAMRRDTNEVAYLETAHWAERLDIGLQRVLAANLSALLATDRVRLSTWRSGEISVAIYVSIERFDVDSSGKAMLTAWWRAQPPDGEKTLASGRFSASHNGPSPETNPEGAVTSMSILIARLAEEISRAVQQR